MRCGNRFKRLFEGFTVINISSSLPHQQRKGQKNEGGKEGKIQWKRREHDMKTKWGLSCPWGWMWRVHWAGVEMKEECKKKRKLLKKGGREGENEDKRCDREVTKLCQLSAGRCEVRDVVRSCADPQAAGQCGWRLCSTSVASGHKSLRIFRPTVSVFLPRERWAATSPQRVWFFPSSRHGWSCQRNLSSLSPSGLLLGLDWRKWLHEFVLFVCLFFTAVKLEIKQDSKLDVFITEMKTSQCWNCIWEFKGAQWWFCMLYSVQRENILHFPKHTIHFRFPTFSTAIGFSSCLHGLKINLLKL